MLRLAALALVSLSLVAGSAAAAGGPAPGTVSGWDGVLTPDGSLRYVAMPSGRTTTVAAVVVRGGRVERFTTVRGTYGVPAVAFDGSAGGLSADGRTLVLASFTGTPYPGAVTRFAILETKRLKLRRVLPLRGSWSYDALSPDGRFLYAIEYLTAGSNPGYRVRAVDLGSGRLLPGAIVDKRKPGEEMRGSPMTRTMGRDGGWAYTLYGEQDGTAFVHALDTRNRRAVCVDLPWRKTQGAISEVRLAVSRNGRLLELRQQGIGRLAVVDTRSFAVRAFRQPVAPRTQSP